MSDYRIVVNDETIHAGQDFETAKNIFTLEWKKGFPTVMYSGGTIVAMANTGRDKGRTFQS